MRYSLYYMDAIITLKRRPMMEIYNYNLKDNDKYFFGGLFSFLLFSSGNNEFKKRQNLIQYFYLPLNEMFLFIFGILIISIGYKYKLRIDYIIIALGLILYLIKIIISLNYYNNKNYFPTLFFYLYDYGELMLNPIFNLPYYLIGIYFGFINFSIQKGIVIKKMDKSDSYAKIEMIGVYHEQDNEEKETNINNKKIINNLEFDELNADSSSRQKSYAIISSKKIEEENNLNNSYKPKKKKKRLNHKKRSNNSYENKNSEIIEESDEKIEEMPFLISPINFLNFHQRNNRKCILRIIIFISFLIIFILVYHITIIYKIRKDKNIEKYSLKNMISNQFLNIFYLFDIEIFIFWFNMFTFIFYSLRSDSADITDFFNNRYWSFFAKSYFSFTVISTPIIIYIFYQSETVVGLSLSNIFLYSSIGIFFILIGDIFFYSCFEFPFKKIFKTYFIGKEIINMEYEDDDDKDL